MKLCIFLFVSFVCLLRKNKGNSAASGVLQTHVFRRRRSADVTGTGRGRFTTYYNFTTYTQTVRESIFMNRFDNFFLNISGVGGGCGIPCNFRVCSQVVKENLVFINLFICFERCCFRHRCATVRHTLHIGVGCCRFSL